MQDLAKQAVELDESDVKAKMHLGVTLVEQGKREVDSVEMIENGLQYLQQALQLAEQLPSEQDRGYVTSVLEPKIQMAQKIKFLKEYEIQEDQKLAVFDDLKVKSSALKKLMITQKIPLEDRPKDTK